MISRNEMPSMPSTYPAPIEGIQLPGAPSMNLNAPYAARDLLPEQRDEWYRHQKAGEREEIRNPADGVLVLLGNEQEKQRAYERREQDDR